MQHLWLQGTPGDIDATSDRPQLLSDESQDKHICSASFCCCACQGSCACLCVQTPALFLTITCSAHAGVWHYIHHLPGEDHRQLQHTGRKYLPLCLSSNWHNNDR